jgi:hypothetical protein
MVPVTVEISRFETLAGNYPDTVGDASFFAQITIGTVTHTTARIDDGDGDFFIPDNLKENWSLTTPIDTAGPPVPITFYINDYDSGGTGDNDEMDTNPYPGERGPITFLLDPRTGKLTNAGGQAFPDPDLDVLQGINDEQGGFFTSGEGDDANDGDGDPNGGEVFFRIKMATGANTDTDGDGLLDSWELWGINNNDRNPTSISLSSTPDLRLPGADVLHKDLYVEVDALQGFALQAAALLDVANAFAAAPNSSVNNPDGQDGINLHFEGGPISGATQDETTITPSTAWTNLDAYGWPMEFDTIKANNFGTAAERSDPNSANILAAKALAYRYGIIGNQYGTSGSSGMAEEPGNDFLITLGSFGLTSGSTLERRVEAGTFMHEFGHTLGLGHGGSESSRGGDLTAGSNTVTNIDTTNLFPGLLVWGDGIPTIVRTMTAGLTPGSKVVTGVTTQDAAGNPTLYPGMLVYGTAPVIPVIPGTLTIGSTTVTVTSDAANTALLKVGRLVSGTGISPGTTIASVDGDKQFTLSTPALASGSQSLTFPTARIESVDTAANTITLDAPVAVLAEAMGTLNSGNTVVTMTNLAGIFNGLIVTGTGIPAGTKVTNVNTGKSQVTLSIAPTASGSQLLSFSPSTMNFGVTTVVAVGTNQVTLNQPASQTGSPTLFFSDEANYKPNYRSVMNYEWQFPAAAQNFVGFPSAFNNSWQLNYSAQALPDIDEVHLNETTSLGGSSSITVGVLRGVNSTNQIVFQQYPTENSSVNWDGDLNTGETTIDPLDINFDGELTNLHGHEDWSNLVYNFTLYNRNFGSGSHSAVVREDYTSPQSFLAIGSPRFPAANPGFVTSGTPLTLVATDDSGAVASVGYRYYPVDTAAPNFTTAPGSAVQFTLSGPDGSYQVETRATDAAGNTESTQTQLIYLDNTAPARNIVQPVAGEYAHSDVLTLDYSISDGAGSGLQSTMVTMDGSPSLSGHGLASGQAIQLLTEMALGTHTFTIAASDNLNNADETTVSFEVIVTPESIKEDVRYFRSIGQVKNDGLANSLLAKLNAAADAIARDNCPTATNIYNAFIHHLNAQSGKGVDATAAAILIADAQYLIEHCDRFAPHLGDDGTAAEAYSAEYWQNNFNIWAVSSMTLGGYTYTKSELLNILKSNAQSDARIGVAQELIAAKLNIVNGSDGTSIQSILADADSLLSGQGKISNGGEKVNRSSDLGELMLEDALLLNAYNAAQL